MWKDSIALIISALTVLLSAISCVTSIRQYIKEVRLRKVERKKLKIQIELLEESIKEKKYIGIEMHIKSLIKIIGEIYPKSETAISIKLIRKSDKSNVENSEVVTLITYPEKRYDMQKIYKIKENTDFCLIVKDSREYFFVSDLKEYSASKTYYNQNKHFIQCYNTSIIVPIQKTVKDKDDIIGFLCVMSPLKLENVKKNKKLIDIVKLTASFFYDYLKENKLNQEAIVIKK